MLQKDVCISLVSPQNVDELLENVLLKHFKAVYEEKKRQHEAERVQKLRYNTLRMTHTTTLESRRKDDDVPFS